MASDEKQNATDAKITNLQHGLNDTNSNTMTNHEILKHLHGIGNILVDINYGISSAQQETSREITLAKESLLYEINKTKEENNNRFSKFDEKLSNLAVTIEEESKKTMRWCVGTIMLGIVGIIIAILYK